MSHTLQRIFRLLGWALVLAIFAKAVVSFGVMLRYQWMSPLTWDSTLYVTVGRGMLNGLLPYVDLFENKPPGIFAVAALALWLRDDFALLGVFQTAALLGLFIAIIGFPLWSGERRLRSRLSWFCCIAFAFLLTHYTADRSGAMQVESFGATFTTIFAVLLAAHSDRPWGTVRISIGALLACAAVMMKEPFALTLAAVCMTLCRTPRAFVRNGVLPGVLSAVFMVLILAAMGVLASYAGVYLHEIFNRHIVDSGSPWTRAFHLHQIWNNLWGYNPLLAIAVPGLLLWRIVQLCHERLIVALARITLLCAATYAVLFAIGLGGPFYGHHFIFGVPFFAALLFANLREAHQLHLPRFVHRHATATTALALAALLLPLNTWDYDADLRAQADSSASARDVAERIDDVLDRCGKEQYLFLGANGFQPYAFTKHSPMGPLFFQYWYYFDTNRRDFRRTFKGMLREAEFVVQGKEEDMGQLTEYIRDKLDKHFSVEPWPCAEGITSPDERYIFHFRTSTW